MPFHAAPHHRRAAFLALGGTGVFVLLVLLANVAVFGSSGVTAPRIPWFTRPRPSTPTASEELVGQKETIVMSMVMFGRASAEEGQHMVKSILMRASAPVQLHVICSEDAVPVLQRRLELVTRPMYDVEVVFYPLPEDRVVARGERAGIGNKRHHAGVGGLAKMFIHELVSAPLTLYVDTDAMFLTDPLHLWRAAHRLTSPPDVLLAFPHAGPRSDGGDICTCVMAMHLDKMRKAPWLESTLRAETVGRALGGKAVWERAGIDPARPPWGDQGLVHAIWRAHPSRFARLSRSWDVSACKYYYGVTLVGEDFRTPGQEAAKYVNLAPARDEAAAKAAAGGVGMSSVGAAGVGLSGTAGGAGAGGAGGGVSSGGGVGVAGVGVGVGRVGLAGAGARKGVNAASQSTEREATQPRDKTSQAAEQARQAGDAGEAYGAGDALAGAGAWDGGKDEWEIDVDMGEVLFPGIVHFNCQGGEKEENVFRSGALRERPEWGPLLVATAQYKWVWLNQGHGTLISRVVPNATFEDERVAAGRAPTRLGALHGAHYGGRARR